MIDLRDRWHRWALAAVLLGNVAAFAGVDPPTRAVTALVVLALAVDLRETFPPVPRALAFSGLLLAGIVLVQLLPLPAGIRNLLQPGLAGLTADGWFSLSVAPWSTVETAAMWTVALGIAVVAARMASTRSGVPALLWTLALTGGLLSLLGLASEAGAPERVLLLRETTRGGSPYGPFVNENHFAVAIELTLPAAIALLAVAARGLTRIGAARRRATAAFLGAGALVVLDLAALVRCHSRGGVLVLLLAAALTIPLWRRARPGRRWPWTLAAVILLAAATVLAWTRIPALAADFQQLFVIRGVEGNDRWDLWGATIDLWERAPVTGIGLGAYRHAIGLDAPPTGAAVLEQAHNDWLEWLATTGIVGAAALALACGWFLWSLRPSRVRSSRFETRYALAAAALALLAAGLHETLGFALQTPANRYLAAVWVGFLWGTSLRMGSPVRDLPTMEESAP